MELKLVTGETTPILLSPSVRVSFPLASEVRDLIESMVPQMRRSKGIGLAANQVGRSERLCTVEVVPGDVRVYINPEIISLGRDKVLFEEGCLSLPGEFYSIIRHEKVIVKYQDATGKTHKEAATGLLAICLQHELDHLAGTLICDRYALQKEEREQALQDQSISGRLD